MAKKIRSINFVFRKTQFATDIKASRIELGYSLDDVAKESRITDGQIGRYEQGKEDNMKLQNFLDICNLYDLNPQDYFELEA